MSIHPNLPPRRASGRNKEEATRKASYQARREEVLRERQHRERHQREEEARARQQRRNNSDERDREGENLFEEGDRAINEWTEKADHSSYEDFLIQNHHTADDVVQILFAALNQMRDERDAVISTIETLVKERTRIRAHMTTKSRSPEKPNSLYRNVGLDENCPDFLLKAARMAYRKQFHPDVHPERDRAEAENRFKEVEAVFAEIMLLRDG